MLSTKYFEKYVTYEPIDEFNNNLIKNIKDINIQLCNI